MAFIYSPFRYTSSAFLFLFSDILKYLAQNDLKHLIDWKEKKHFCLFSANKTNDLTQTSSAHLYSIRDWWTFIKSTLFIWKKKSRPTADDWMRWCLRDRCCFENILDTFLHLSSKFTFIFVMDRSTTLCSNFGRHLFICGILKWINIQNAIYNLLIIIYLLKTFNCVFSIEFQVEITP